MFNGNVIVGQSGGPTAVINSSLAGVYTAAKKAGAEKVYGMKYGIEGLIKNDIVDLDTKIKDPENLEILRRTPSSYLGSCRYRLPAEEVGKEIYEAIFANLAEHNITAMLYIGGNDSMDTIAKLHSYAAKIGSDIKFVGVPKSIDNDLPGTDHTPGFGSAAKYLGAVTKEIICDATVYDMKSVTVVEIMGRDAGWLTAATALSKGEDCDGPDMILLPERILDLDKLISKIELLQETKKSLTITVSEGVKVADGRYLCELAGDEKRKDAFGHHMLSGTAQFLADTINRRVGCKTRGVELNTPQRAAAHLLSKTDFDEAFMVGAVAAEAAIKGKTGEMAAFVREKDAAGNYKVDIKTVAISVVANKEQIVPNEYITAEGDNVTQAFINYARPLIEGYVEPIWKDGMPVVLKR